MTNHSAPKGASPERLGRILVGLWEVGAAAEPFPVSLNLDIASDTLEAILRGRKERVIEKRVSRMEG